MKKRWPEILLEEAACKWSLKLGKDRTLGDRVVCVREQEPGGRPSRTSSSARDTPRGAADGDEGPRGCTSDTHLLLEVGGARGVTPQPRQTAVGASTCVLGMWAWGKLTVHAHTHPGPGQALDLIHGPFIGRSRAGLDCSILTKEAF